jgi:hypothetical protein
MNQFAKEVLEIKWWKVLIGVLSVIFWDFLTYHQWACSCAAISGGCSFNWMKYDYFPSGQCYCGCMSFLELVDNYLFRLIYPFVISYLTFSLIEALINRYKKK